VAHRVDSLRCEGSDAIGGAADIDWPRAPIASNAYDPSATSAAHFAVLHNVVVCRHP